MALDVVTAPGHGNQTIFLSGPAGTGKTTLALQRMVHLLEKGIPAEQILVLLPQRTLASPYYAALASATLAPGGQVDVATIGGLAQRTLDLFWPMVFRAAGFRSTGQRPQFLTLETTQYYLDRIADPFIAAGAFDGITIPRPRLVSQIIDNLNKAAAVGFPPQEIAARLKGAWGGESSRLRIYDQVQAVALAFREACLAENLLDWSLQIEVFWHYLLPLPELRRYLLGGYRHLIVDNTEEDIPATQDLLKIWLPLCESALLIHDTDGGYRVFLGADPLGALALGQICRERVVLTDSYVTTPEMAAFGHELAWATAPGAPAALADTSSALAFPADEIRFYPQMLDWAAEQISRLVMEEGIPPGEIALLAPFVSDALRFLLAERLNRYGIAVRTHRPSRELVEEPAARCLLTLAKLAYPGWRGQRPAPAVGDVAQALAMAIEDLDPVRARLLTEIVYRERDGRPWLTPFHQIQPETQDRISYFLGMRYVELWQWIQNYAREAETRGSLEGLHVFWSRLFGEVLSQAGFGFHHDLDAGAVTANLIESVLKFRRAFPPHLQQDGADLALQYLDLVERGLLAAQYVSTWPSRSEPAVLLLPAYTFLMSNLPVTIQVWLDAGSVAWFERIHQPLTHPFVLQRDWPAGRVWTDEDEVLAQQAALHRLVLGLTRRCRKRIYLAYSLLNEQGFEQQGPLLQSVERMLRRQRKGAA